MPKVDGAVACVSVIRPGNRMLTAVSNQNKSTGANTFLLWRENIEDVKSRI